MKKLLTSYTLILILTLKLSAFNFQPTPQQLSAYYISPSQNIKLLYSKLKNNNFTILASTKVLEKYNIITITNQELQNTNSYLATLQINVNDKEIRIQNPSYFAAAYLGKNYYYGQFKDTINALENVFGKLEQGSQKADFETLSTYCFMYGLPQKEDTLIIKKEIKPRERILIIKRKKYIAYTLTLPNGSILVGHKLKKKTNKFLKILKEEKNAQILPYESMIIKEEVSILNPKYYIALSLPMLSLEEFIQIASVPDQIYRNIKKAYH